MIKVYKSPNPPKSLVKGKRYDEEDVRRQLIDDQRGKCYLCERKAGTEFEIDHVRSQNQYPDERLNWSNLLLICGYCNRKKGNWFDDIPDPTLEHIEELIVQEIDYTNKRARFTPSQPDPAPQVNAIIKLLSSIYNGSKPTRKVKEELFFEQMISVMNLFTRAVNLFLQKRSEVSKNLVREYLRDDEEFLGFKYWIIYSSEELREVFVDECKWNK